MKNISSVSKWPFQHTKMAILRKWGYVLKWPFWGNGGMVANSTNSGAFYTILTNIWHPWRSWVRLHMEVQLELWEKFESNLLVCNGPEKKLEPMNNLKFHWSLISGPPQTNYLMQKESEQTENSTLYNTYFKVVTCPYCWTLLKLIGKNPKYGETM